MKFDDSKHDGMLKKECDDSKRYSCLLQTQNLLHLRVGIGHVVPVTVHIAAAEVHLFNVKQVFVMIRHTPRRSVK